MPPLSQKSNLASPKLCQGQSKELDSIFLLRKIKCFLLLMLSTSTSKCFLSRNNSCQPWHHLPVGNTVLNGSVGVSHQPYLRKRQNLISYGGNFSSLPSSLQDYHPDR